MSAAVESLKKRLKKDDTWKTFRHIVSMSWSPEFDNFGPEALRLHKTRELRLLKRGNRASKLGDASLQDQATRSRLVEIAITVLDKRNGLEKAIHGTYKHIEAHYSSMLFAKGCKLKTEQKAVIESALSTARGKLEQMDTLIEIVDRIIEDCDQGGFALKRSLDALDIATKRQ